MALCTLPFPTMSAFFFWTYPCNPIFFAHINTLFLTFLITFYLYYLLFFQQIPCTTLTFSGTPSSGLVFWARLLWTPFPRNNNGLSSWTLPLLSFYPKPIFSASFRSNMTSFIGTPTSGSPLSDLTANPLLSSKVLYHAKTATPSSQRSNLPSTMHSHAPTPESFTPTPMIISGAHATIHPPPLNPPHPFRNKLVSITSWQSNMRTLAPPSPLNPPKHLFPVLSGLVQVDGGLPCGLVQGITT